MSALNIEVQPQLNCETVCSPEQQLGCSKFVGQTALQLSLENHNVQTGSEVLDEFEARPYQIEAWEALRASRQAGDSSGLVHLATGLGKTTVGVIDALRFIEEFNEGRDPEDFAMPKILFAVHQKEILDQAAERFKAFAPLIAQGQYADGQKNKSQPITFATMQSLHQNLESFNPEEFDYIIYDEAHHAQAETFNQVVEHFTPTYQLALTATPDRMDGLDIRKLFGNEIYKKDLAQALTEGWLADVDYHIRFDVAVKEAMEGGFEGSTLKELEGLLKNESRNSIIAEHIRDQIIELGLQNAKTILFCQTIDHAEDMASLLGGKAYHSEVGKEDRKKILKNFRSGGVNLITTRDMFNEGVDIPDARLVVFLRSTGSKTIFEQQLGRGLRKAKGKDTVTVLDFVANIERLEHLRDLTSDVREQEGATVQTEQAEINKTDYGSSEGDDSFKLHSVN